MTTIQINREQLLRACGLAGVPHTVALRIMAYLPQLPNGESTDPAPGATWTVRHYTGQEWPLIKGVGIELECAGASREQAEAIADTLNRARSARRQAAAALDWYDQQMAENEHGMSRDAFHLFVLGLLGVGDEPPADEYKPEYKTLIDHNGRIIGVRWENIEDRPPVGAASQVSPAMARPSKPPAWKPE